MILVPELYSPSEASTVQVPNKLYQVKRLTFASGSMSHWANNWLDSQLDCPSRDQSWEHPKPPRLTQVFGKPSEQTADKLWILKHKPK